MLALDDGERTTIGEASPLPGYSPESIDACERALCSIEEALEPIEAASPRELPEGFVRAVAGRGRSLLSEVPSARFALETALWALARAREPDGGAASTREIEARLSLVPRSFVVGGGVSEPERWAMLAVERLARASSAGGTRSGFAAVKVKVGRRDLPFERELEGVRRLREVLPASFELRVDANGAFSLRDAPSRIEALARAGASSIEEPCRGASLVVLGSQAIPWLADESLADPSLAPRLMDAPGCGGLVLKPALLGGALRSLELAREAALRGIRVAYSHLFDGPFALRMIAELATLSPLGPLASATSWHEGLEAWPKVRHEIGEVEDPRDVLCPWRSYRSSPEDLGFGPRASRST